MKRNLMIYGAVVLAGLMAMKAPAMAQLRNLPMMHSNAAVGQAVTLQDQQFIMQTAQRYIADSLMSELALKNSTNPEVHALATKIIQDNARTNRDLAAITRRTGLPMPQTLSPVQQTTYNQLSTLTGSDFDQLYVQQMLQSQKDAVGLFRNQRTLGNLPALRDYASKELPSMESQLAMLEQQAVAVSPPPVAPMSAPVVRQIQTTESTTETWSQTPEAMQPQAPSQGRSAVRGYW